MKDREIIHAALHEIARRILLNRVLRELVYAAGVVLFSLLAFQLVRPAAGRAGMPLIAGLGIGLACFCIYVAWRAFRRIPLSQAAGEADARARLKDELKSACWFLTAEGATPFVREQVARAARTAQGLDPAALVPARTPRNLPIVTALAVLLAVTSWVMPQLSHSWETLARHDRPAYPKDAADLRARLKELLPDPEVRQVEQALSVIERPEASAEEVERAVKAVREAAEQMNMRAAAASETLADLAATMAGRADLARAAEALDDGRTQEAMALVQRAVRDAAEGGMDTDRETLQRTLRIIEEADDVMQARNEIAEIQREMQDFHALSAQQSPYSPGQPDPSPPPEAGRVQLHSGGVSQLGARLRLDDDESKQDGSGVGMGSGDSPSLALEGASTARLDVQLQLEAVRVESGEGGEPADASWFLVPSREQAAGAGLASVREERAYTRADVMSPARIPLRQRQLVKDYFINLHESQDQ